MNRPIRTTKRQRKARHQLADCHLRHEQPQLKAVRHDIALADLAKANRRNKKWRRAARRENAQ